MDNIYDYFNCSSNEELYEMLMSEDDQVSELSDFYEVMNQEIRTNAFQIRGSSDVINFVEEYNIAPQKGTVTVAALNTKNEVNNWSNFSTDIPKQEAYASFFNEEVARLLVFGHDQDIDYILDMEETFTIGGIKTLDTMIINPENRNEMYSFAESAENYYTSFKAVFDNRYSTPYRLNDSSYLVQKNDSIIAGFTKYVVNDNLLDSNIINDIYQLKGLDEFNNYYMKNTLLDKHVFMDEDEIIKSLKIGLQEYSQENIYMVTYDDNYTINQVNHLSLGALSSTQIPPQVVMSRFLDEEVAGAFFVHNHPSGHSEPSEADLNSTLRQLDLSEALDKEFIEHYVIATQGHTKISDHLHRLRITKEEARDNTSDRQMSLSLNERMDQIEKKQSKFISQDVLEKER